jgi:hypothetical protein
MLTKKFLRKYKQLLTSTWECEKGKNAPRKETEGRGEDAETIESPILEPKHH